MHKVRSAIGIARWVLLGWLVAAAGTTQAFQLGNRWSTTAISGGNLSQGDPTTVTWGLVVDCTSISGPEGTSESNLASFLDTHVGTMDVWLPLFEDAFRRWSEVSGLTFVYEPINSSTAIDETAYPVGSAGFVPDIRIGGHSIDGAGESNTVAYSYPPNHGDIVLDTDNSDFLGNSTDSYRRLRNTVMHEVGHGLGIHHVESDNASFLMEPNISSSFDGPQLDDILAVQRLYGDAWEKQGGNDSFVTATPLGSLTAGPVTIGGDADDTVVAADQIDFISIDDNSDLDYFSFTIDHPSLLSARLTPKGPTYSQGSADGPQSPFYSNALSELSLRVYDTDGATILASANEYGAGGTATISDIGLDAAGIYFVQVSGLANSVQLYQLDLEASPDFLLGDVNLDGILSFGSGNPADDDVAAFIAGWRTVLPHDNDRAAWMKGDLNFDRQSTLADFALMRQAFADADIGAQLAALFAVPEPTTAPGALLAMTFLLVARRVAEVEWSEPPGNVHD